MYVYLAVDRYLGCSQFLVIIGRATMSTVNIGLCVDMVSFCGWVYKYRNGMTDIWLRYVEFFKNSQTAFQNDCINFYSH